MRACVFVRVCVCACVCVCARLLIFIRVDPSSHCPEEAVFLPVISPVKSQKLYIVLPYSITGQISDPMAVYRESKLANVWTDEEKRIFREK